MTQNEKEMLMKDLCARMPYGIKLQHVKNTDSVVELYSIDLDDFYCKIQFYTYKGKSLTASEEGKLLRPGGILRYKPYLFPLSSMTEEQWKDTPYANLNNFTFESFKCGCSTLAFYTYEVNLSYVVDFINWCYKNHFDVYGLIEKGLAIDATNLNIY